MVEKDKRKKDLLDFFQTARGYFLKFTLEEFNVPAPDSLSFGRGNNFQNPGPLNFISAGRRAGLRQSVLTLPETQFVILVECEWIYFYNHQRGVF